jgi:hypothetical protein
MNSKTIFCETGNDSDRFPCLPCWSTYWFNTKTRRRQLNKCISNQNRLSTLSTNVVARFIDQSEIKKRKRTRINTWHHECVIQMFRFIRFNHWFFGMVSYYYSFIYLFQRNCVLSFSIDNDNFHSNNQGINYRLIIILIIININIKRIFISFSNILLI